MIIMWIYLFEWFCWRYYYDILITMYSPKLMLDVSFPYVESAEIIIELITYLEESKCILDSKVALRLKSNSITKFNFEQFSS